MNGFIVKIKTLFVLLLVVGFAILASPAEVWALDVTPGQFVILKAKKDLGVPLHSSPFPSLKGRVQDSTKAEVIGTDGIRHWIQLSLPDAREGWIVEKYVKEVVDDGGGNNGGEGPIDLAADEKKVWGSLSGCREVVGQGRRRPKDDDEIRLASWNIRWFPDGQPNQSSSGTDLDWLACSLAWMDVDAVALQEIKTTGNANSAWSQVTNKLASDVGGDWKVKLNGCSNADKQHVGFLWNADKLDFSNEQEIWQMNGSADDASSPCAGNLRPGYGGLFESKDANGFDFYAVSVHLDSGTKNKDFNTRQTAYDRLDAVASLADSLDKDVLILGDFNTMGNKDGNVSALKELNTLKSKAASESPGFDRLDVNPACTEYYQKKGGWLDHVLVTKNTEELSDPNVSVTGYCAVEGCAPISGSMPAAYTNLSDHCPLLVDFSNSDLDN